MSTAFKFRATTPNLNVAVPGARNGVQFRDHVLTTTDPNLAEQLRSHPCCNAEYSEETAAQRAAIEKVVVDNAPGDKKPGGDEPDGDKKLDGDKKPDGGKPKGK